jgi:hypothetical protein
VRVSELISARVVDRAGNDLGRVRDLRVAAAAGDGDRASAGAPIAGLTVGGGRLVHAWGYAEGRATGPWLFRVLLRRAAARAVFFRSDHVLDWGPAVVVVTRIEDGVPLTEAVAAP